MHAACLPSGRSPSECKPTVCGTEHIAARSPFGHVSMGKNTGGHFWLTAPMTYQVKVTISASAQEISQQAEKPK